MTRLDQDSPRKLMMKLKSLKLVMMRLTVLKIVNQELVLINTKLGFMIQLITNAIFSSTVAAVEIPTGKSLNYDPNTQIKPSPLSTFLALYTATNLVILFKNYIS